MNLRVTTLYVTEMVVELHGAANLEQFKTFGTRVSNVIATEPGFTIELTIIETRNCLPISPIS